MIKLLNTTYFHSDSLLFSVQAIVSENVAYIQKVAILMAVLPGSSMSQMCVSKSLSVHKVGDIFCYLFIYLET